MEKSKVKIWMIWDSKFNRSVAESHKVIMLNRMLKNLQENSTEERYELKERK